MQLDEATLTFNADVSLVRTCTAYCGKYFSGSMQHCYLYIVER